MKKFHTECLICNNKKILPLKDYKKHDLVKCKNCGFVFMRAIPTVEDLNNHYSIYSYERPQYISPITISSYNKLLDEFEIKRKNNKILDVGCGAGSFLEEAKKRGWNVYGTEYSKTAVKLCTNKGINMHEGTLDKTNYEDSSFDIITSFEVIEHINNPVEQVTQIHSLLRKGGLFYITTPNFNSLLRYFLKDNYNIIEYPEHLTYFTQRTLATLMTKIGFKRKKFLCTGFSITRFKESLGTTEINLVPENSLDENLRNKIHKKWHLLALKNFINFLLTMTSTGMALKGYYEKTK